MKLLFLFLGILFFVTTHAQVEYFGKVKGKTNQKADKKNNDHNDEADTKKIEPKKEKKKDEQEQWGVKRVRDKTDEDNDDEHNDGPSPKKQRSDEKKIQVVAPKVTDEDIQEVMEAKTMDDLQAIFDRLLEEGKIEGHDRMGFASPEILTTNRKNFEGERGLQVMRHIISQLFYMSGALDTDKKNPVEFQMMHIRNKKGEDKFFIASNNRKSLNNVKNVVSKVEDTEEFMEKHMLVDYSDRPKEKNVAVMVQRFQKKLANLYKMQIDEESDRFEAKEFLDHFLNGIESGNAGSLDLIRRYTKDLLEEPVKNILEDHETSVFFVFGPNKLHAEMKFIEMLNNMEKADNHALDGCDITIIGTRRPCAGCAGKLRLFDDRRELKSDESTSSCEFHYTLEQGRIWRQPLLQLIESTEDENRLMDILKELFQSSYESERVGKTANEESISEADDMDLKRKEKKDKEKK